MSDWTITVIVGPTAVGKTSAAIRHAQRIGGEIVSADSMQVYRGLELGTAKPTAAERAQAQHHLLDLAEPDEDFSVAQFRRAGDEALSDLQARAVPAVVCGGTGLYVRALIDGMVEGPPPDEEFRARHWEQVRRLGAGALHQRLVEIDPVAAEQIHPNDAKRIIRALEIHALTGKTRTQWQAEQAPPRWAGYSTFIGLQRPWDELDDRINRRVEWMFGAGLVDEVRSLAPQLSATARQALGYKEVLEFLDGAMTLTDCQALVAQRTRRFARRQMIWLRPDSRIRWVHPEQWSRTITIPPFANLAD